MTSLKQRALSATAWSGADILLRNGVQFVVSVALARLLSPEDFGVIAMLYLFTGVAGAFVDSGFSTALIRQQDTTHVDESTVFWFNLAIGSVLALSMVALSRHIAAYFGHPVLVPLAWAMAANIFISALSSIHVTLLTKKLEFRSQMKIGLAASLVSGAVAIWMAKAGSGVWALAAQVVSASVCTTAMLWWVSSWRPRWEFSFSSARRLFGFGSYMLGSSLLDIFYTRLYSVLIGKQFGARDLGFYSRADGTKQLPVGVLTGILSRVALPVFSKVSGDPEKLRRGVRMSLSGMMLINVPMMFGLAAVAEVFIVAVLGEQWLPAAPILQVLCLAGVFWPLHVINLNVLLAQGYSNLFFRLEVIKKVLGISLLLLGSLYGIMGIAWSTVLFGALAFLINAYYTKQFLDYGAFQQTKDFLPVTLISLIMFAIVRRASTSWAPQPAIELMALVALGALVFVGLAHLLSIRSYRDAAATLRSALAKNQE
ncbi:lipopolysaccharide biosynthesis protein [Pseudoxanthomonas koreensis]|uniref:lipopolysaccharide biosynthesis protein n=1 Tax=Pseudoxanthomonas koreensis TaxID=266061 RepID=UPI001390A388|nr:lipopolysaccharide biosynthesis protein [Pseudoxanthomonas koreensis]KAF1695301.1 flippase [Pseudoxanthomonas koreensis]